MSHFEISMACLAFSVWGTVWGMWLHYRFGHSLFDDCKFTGEGYDVQQLSKRD